MCSIVVIVCDDLCAQKRADRAAQHAGETAGTGGTPAANAWGGAKLAHPSGTTSGVSWAKHALQGYNMKLWISNQMKLGLAAWDPLPVPPGDCGDQGIGLEYPVGKCIEHLFGAGPWIGGIVKGVRRVDEGYNGDDGRSEFLPQRQDTARDRIWHTHTGLESYDSNGYRGYYYIHNIRVNRRGVDGDGDGRIDDDELDGRDNDADRNPLRAEPGR